MLILTSDKPKYNILLKKVANCKQNILYTTLGEDKTTNHKPNTYILLKKVTNGSSNILYMPLDLEQNGFSANNSDIITYNIYDYAENFAGGLSFSHISPIELGFGLAIPFIIPLTMINSYQNSPPYTYFFENSQLSRTQYIIILIDKDYFSPQPLPIDKFLLFRQHIIYYIQKDYNNLTPSPSLLCSFRSVLR